MLDRTGRRHHEPAPWNARALVFAVDCACRPPSGRPDQAAVGIRTISDSGRISRVSTSIEVVSSGVDWAGIAAAGATVVAAIGGIWGTSWQARRAREAATADLQKSIASAAENLRVSVSADDFRTRVAEKRRIYANCLAAANELSAALIDDRVSRSTLGDDGSAYREMERTRTVFQYGDEHDRASHC
jgi:hypothetical protein